MPLLKQPLFTLLTIVTYQYTIQNARGPTSNIQKRKERSRPPLFTAHKDRQTVTLKESSKAVGPLSAMSFVNSRFQRMYLELTNSSTVEYERYASRILSIYQSRYSIYSKTCVQQGSLLLMTALNAVIFYQARQRYLHWKPTFV